MGGADIIQALGGFGGLAALLTSLAAWRKSTQTEQTTGATITEVSRQFKPDHGESMADKINGILTSQDLHTSMIESLGHQVGEIRADAQQFRDIEDKRISRLEKRQEQTMDIARDMMLGRLKKGDTPPAGSN